MVILLEIKEQGELSVACACVQSVVLDWMASRCHEYKNGGSEHPSQEVVAVFCGRLC